MRNSILILLILLPSTILSQNKSDVIDKFITEGKEFWSIPGMSVVIVQNDSTVYKKTYGVKNYFNNEPVDSKTIFSMASTTKAFIAMGLGILVDRDSINWDDKVTSHFPSFKLSDDYITKDARVKDLLTHNLGIGNEDRLWTTDSTSVDEMLYNFSKSKKKYSLRGGYTYQNIMYVIAGKVIENVSGMSWQDFIEVNILDKIDFSCTLTWSQDIFNYKNHTYPHMIDYDEGIVNIPFTISDQIGAAGMMWSCADDMEKYLNFLLNKSEVNGEKVLSENTFNYIFEPQILIGNSFYPTSKLTKPKWKTYGLGWFQHDYRGYKIDMHTGSLQGLVAIIALVRDKNIGVQVFANLDGAELRHAIIYKVFDLLLFDDDSRDWNGEVYSLYKERSEKYKKSYQDIFTNRDIESKMSLNLEDYVGVYSSEMYGEVSISLNKSKLKKGKPYLNADINNDIKNFDLQWWENDTFITDKDEKWREKLLIDFIVEDKISKQLIIYDVTFNKKN
jgi:CubicO group peptidase (beta-lactamase class C family)